MYVQVKVFTESRNYCKNSDSVDLVSMMYSYGMESSSSESKIMSSEFAQLSPLHSPQAVTHLRPFFQHEHTLVPQGFFEESLHLHRTNFNSVSGAGAMSVIIGDRVVPSESSVQPHC